MKREHKDVKWLPEHKKQSTLWYMLFWRAVAAEFGMTTMEDIWMLQSNLYNEVDLPMMAISGPRRMVLVIGRTLTIVVIHAWPFLVLDTSKDQVFLVHDLSIPILLLLVHDEHTDQPSPPPHDPCGGLRLVQAPGRHSAGFWSREQVLPGLFSGGLNFQAYSPP
ncbi:hypothetical protein KC19_8G161200 [Ceratodon purpureus]|uniref:Uncharacterized protein n=1 Tax=Ceratodon purpureus TaxID=3225 RepID=A0A8T0H408_CERPU|nr:hypothetical protein KC19_8G161200 [Ceratodon purpureus]